MSFEAFLTRYGREGAILLASTVVSYLLTYKTSLTPPMKPRDFVFSMSLITEVFALVSVANAKRGKRPKLALFATALVVYVAGLVLLTYQVPTSRDNYREVRGFVCKSTYQAIHPEECPLVLDPERIADASFEPQRIWEAWSILAVRSVLTASWLVLIWVTVESVALTVKRGQERNQTTPKRSRQREASD